MKTKILLSIAFVFVSISLWAQNTHMFSINGGYAFTNLDEEQSFNPDEKVKAEGWRVDAIYEFQPEGQPITFGFLVGYAELMASETFSVVLNQTADYKIYTVPLAFSPKVFFGKGKLKAFIKVDIGMQFSGMKRTGTQTELEANDFGLMLGAGGGGMLDITEKVFINVEYDIDWLTNAYYEGGWLNSALFGIGMKF